MLFCYQAFIKFQITKGGFLRSFKIIPVLLIIMILSPDTAFAQEGQATISGFIKDAATGEVLIGTNILLYKDSISVINPPYRGAASNKYGFYAVPNVARGK